MLRWVYTITRGKELDSVTKRIHVLVVIVSLKDFCQKADGAVKQIGTES